MNGISDPTKGTPEISLVPSSMQGHSGKWLLQNRKQALTRHLSAGALILDFTVSRLRNKCLLFISHLIYGIFVTVA